MRKLLLITLISFVLVIISPVITLADEIVWELIVQNKQINERVVISKDRISDFTEQWTGKESDNRVVMERVTEDWEDYRSLPDSFPIKASVKSYFVGQWVIVELDKDRLTALDVFTRPDDKIDFYVKVPGIIWHNSADEVKDATAVWQFCDREQLAASSVFMCKAFVIDGFRLGLAIFGIGISIVILMFIRFIRKVDKMIEEEYSLENLQKDKKDTEEK